MFRIWRWLIPGLNLKRWLALFVVGIALMGYSLSLAFQGGRLFTRVENFITRLVLQDLLDGRLSEAWLSAIVGLVGAVLAFGSMFRVVRSVLETLNPGESAMAEKFYLRRQLTRGPKVVAVGGGTGLPSVLRGMKEFTANISAVVTVADDGGSSGRLRTQFGILPPGDLRNCLVALADTEPLMERLFQYRFEAGEGLSGHTFGNLFILAMTETTGDFYTAVRQSSQVLAVRGRVMPSTLDQVTLKAELADGRVVVGESAITGAGGRVRRVFLHPQDCRPVEDALRAVEEADVVILGPGSLFTSIIPNLLVTGMAAAIRRSPALKVYVCNIMTQPGETADYAASAHVRAVLDHAGYGLIDVVLVNTGPIPEASQRRYAERGARPVEPDVAELARLGVDVVRADLVDTSGDLVRHHPDKLAAAIARLTVERPSRPDRPPWEFLWLRQRLAEKTRAARRGRPGR